MLISVNFSKAVMQKCRLLKHLTECLESTVMIHDTVTTDDIH